MQSNQEISLVDFINIVIKGKKTLFLFLAIGAVLGVGIDLTKLNSMTSSGTTYQSSAIIELGTISREQMFGFIAEPAEKPEHLVAKIGTGVFNKPLSVHASIVKNSNLIEVAVSSLNKEESKNALTDSVQAILAADNGMINSYKDNIQENMRQLRESINRYAASGRQTENLEIQVSRLESALMNTTNSKVISYSYTASSNDTSQVKKAATMVFLVVIGCLLGLIIGLIVVFSQNWWSKNKANIQF